MCISMCLHLNISITAAAMPILPVIWALLLRSGALVCNSARGPARVILSTAPWRAGLPHAQAEDKWQHGYGHEAPANSRRSSAQSQALTPSELDCHAMVASQYHNQWLLLWPLQPKLQSSLSQ